MSAVVFLIVLCLVLAYILYDTSKKNKHIMEPEPSTVFKKHNSYTIECEILNDMVKQKTQSNSSTWKRKVSIHFKGNEKTVEGLKNIIPKLSNTIDFYLIINTNEPSTELLTQLQSLVDKTKIFKCKTYEGELALIRQLSSCIHIETDLNVIKSLKPYLNNIVTIQSVIEPEVSILKSSTNLYSFENLTEVFTNLDKVKV